MSTASSQNNDNQEIDLSQVSKKIGNLFEGIANLIFQLLLFVKRNILIIGILFVVGAVLGWYMDKNSRQYDNQIIVTPNFSSVDYLYSKVSLINSKVKEGDSLFLKNVVGIKNTKTFGTIEIEPITDIYTFIGNKPVNFDFIKLLAEDGDLKKIVEDKLTSKNYAFHSLSFSTSEPTSEAETVQPILNYLNNSDYYRTIQKEYVNNIKVKMIENDSIIKQINAILNSFSNTVSHSPKSSSLVYYNENTELNDVIKTKNELIAEQGSRRLELVGVDKIIKESSSVINVRESDSLNGKMKLIIPMFFLFLYAIVVLFVAFYKRQLAKSKA